ncbi:MAG: YlzJ-like family protein [Veillonellales bacterium]
MPLSLVWGQPQGSLPPYEEIEYTGTKMQVTKLSDNQWQIIRILSTDPQDYLREDIQPGTVLVSTPVFKALAH